MERQIYVQKTLEQRDRQGRLKDIKYRKIDSIKIYYRLLCLEMDK